MSQQTDQLIAQFEAGGEKLAGAIRGLSPQTLLREPPADAGPEIGKWTIHEVVIHLADAEAAFADRIRRLIATDNPTLLAWDENQFSANLFYKDQSAEDAATLIQLTRRQLARVLRKLPDSAFDRAGTHSERGRQTLAEVIGFDVWHIDHHMKFIEAKKALFEGNPNDEIRNPNQ